MRKGVVVYEYSEENINVGSCCAQIGHSWPSAKLFYVPFITPGNQIISLLPLP